MFWLALIDNRKMMKLEMKMTVEVGQDGTFGKITFRGTAGFVTFSSIMKVDFTNEGTRVLHHILFKSFLYRKEDKLKTREYFNNLYESNGKYGQFQI